MAQVTVLGAGGFMGRAVRRALAESGHECRCVDRVSPPTGSREAWRVADLLEAGEEQLLDLLADGSPTAVVNCAGLVEGNPDALTRANFLLPLRLVEATGQHVRLVHLGSAAEYGMAKVGTSLDEEAATTPSTVYGITKLAGSHAVAAAARAGADAVVLRVFNPLGPGMPTSSMPGRVTELVRQAIASDAAMISMGPLDAWRDFIDIRDVADAVSLVALADRLPAPVLNVGTGVATQSRAVVRAIADAAGWHGEILEDESLGSPRSVGVAWQQAATERLRSLGWRPSHDLAETAATMVGSNA
jgi:nucleoside-diphosphate-sugar epimerase